MSFEIPTDLIREVQILLRNHSGVPTYDPEDPSLPSLPSLEDSLSELEPSPPYLRCKNCKGRLLRGLESAICVYCGEEQRKEVPPEPIKFKSTVGCRWLLEALDLNGSEIVGPPVEENESYRGQNTQKDEISVSELLDLEIEWPAELENFEESDTNNASSKSRTLLNLAGVDLDDFFSESKRDTVIDASKEQFDPNTLIRNTGSDAFQGQKDLNLFENIQPSETAMWSSVDRTGGSFSGWEKNTSESSTSQGQTDLNLFENIQPSENAIRSSVDRTGNSFSGWENNTSKSSTFQGQKDLNLFENIQPSETPIQPSVDKTGDGFSGWEKNTSESSTFQGHENLNIVKNVQPYESTVRSTDGKSADRFSGWEEEFQSSTSGTLHGDSSSFDPFEGSAAVDLSAHMDTVFGVGNDAKDLKPKDDSATLASTTNDWNQDDLWTNLQSPVPKQAEQFEDTLKVKDGGMLDNTNDSHTMTVDRIQDVQWQISSTKEPDNDTINEDDSFDAWNDFTSSSSQEPPDSSLKHTSNHMISSAEQSSTNNLEDMEFGSFEQPDLFTGAFSNQNGSKEVDIMQSETSILDRMADESIKGGAKIGEDHLNETITTSKVDDVEMLMSQMHDLSFMLESNLSVPNR